MGDKCTSWWDYQNGILQGFLDYIEVQIFEEMETNSYYDVKPCDIYRMHICRKFPKGPFVISQT